MDIKKQLFNEIDYHLLNDEKPSDYFGDLLRNNLIFRLYPFNMLSSLVNVGQSPIYHPEGSVWNHTMMVVDMAASKGYQSRNREVFMWSALLHDIGKNGTTKVRNGRITSYDHDIQGFFLAKRFLGEFKKDLTFIEQVASMVRWHMQFMFVVKELPYAEVDRMLEDCDIHEIALLALCDRLGRGGLSEKKIEEEERNIKLFIDSIYKV